MFGTLNVMTAFDPRSRNNPVEVCVVAPAIKNDPNDVEPSNNNNKTDHETKIPKIQESDFLRAMGIPLGCLKVLGLFPAKNLFTSGGFCSRISISYWTLPLTCIIFAASLLMSLGSFIDLLVLIKGHHCVSFIAGTAGASAYYSMGTMDIVFLILLIPQLPKVGRMWTKIEADHLIYGRDKHIVLQTAFILTIIVPSCIVDNSLYHCHWYIGSNWHNSGTNKTNSGPTVWKETLDFLEANCEMNSVWLQEYFKMPCSHPATGFLAVITDVTVLLLRNLCDVLLILTARALAKRYELVGNFVESASERGETVNWTKIRRDHQMVTSLLWEMNRILSPFVFIGVLSAAFHITLQIYLSLLPEEDVGPVDTVYFCWSLFHLLLRACSICGSTILVHEHSIVPLKTIQKLDAEEYSSEVQRFERHLRSDHLGINGFGCFTMTRRFVCGVISFIFTVEILFLQSENWYNEADGESCPG